ncbi:Uncharacterised protein [Escherichia coli]|nr:Uncharacterised protein [Escherichia coli]CAD5596657.1 Uncharacterised protein [Escherichia coli]
MIWFIIIYRSENHQCGMELIHIVFSMLLKMT